MLTQCTDAYIQHVHTPCFPSPLWGALGACPLLESFSHSMVPFHHSGLQCLVDLKTFPTLSVDSLVDLA